jgi:hypothetical protein
MSIRGIRSVYSNPTDSVNNRLYRDAISVNLATTDLTITGWMRILGNTADLVRGQVPFSISDGLISVGALFMTQSPTTPYDMFMGVYAAGIRSDFGSFSVAAGEDVFYALTWDHSTGTWSGYVSKDGVNSMGSPASNGVGGATATMSVLTVGGIQFSSFWGWNVECTNVKVWVGRVLNTTEMLAEKVIDTVASSTSIAADYLLPNSSTLGNSAGSFAQLLVQGTITDALALNPADLVVGSGGGGGGQTAAKYGTQHLENGFGPAPAAGLEGVMNS